MSAGGEKADLAWTLALYGSCADCVDVTINVNANHGLRCLETGLKGDWLISL